MKKNLSQNVNVGGIKQEAPLPLMEQQKSYALYWSKHKIILTQAFFIVRGRSKGIVSNIITQLKIRNKRNLYTKKYTTRFYIMDLRSTHLYAVKRI